jgi:hypothetical protein
MTVLASLDLYVRTHRRAMPVALGGEAVLVDDQVAVVGAHVHSRAVSVDLAQVARRRGSGRELGTSYRDRHSRQNVETSWWAGWTCTQLNPEST